MHGRPGHFLLLLSHLAINELLSADPQTPSDHQLLMRAILQSVRAAEAQLPWITLVLKEYEQLITTITNTGDKLTATYRSASL